MEIWPGEMDSNGDGHKRPKYIHHHGSRAGAAEADTKELYRMYAPPTALPVGLDAFRDLVSIVIDPMPLVIVAVLFVRSRGRLTVEFDIRLSHPASFVLAPSTEHFNPGRWGQASE